MTRVGRLLAAAVLSFVLVSGVINWLAVSLGGRQWVLLFSVVWLMPIAAITLFVVSSRTGRAVVGRIADSPIHLAVSVLAVLGFLFTLLPWKTSARGIVAYLAMSGTALSLLLAVARPVPGRLLVFPRTAGRFLLQGLRPVPFLMLTSGAILAVTNLISWQVFQHFPHVVDSIAQVFQGHIFASGRIALPARFDDYFFRFMSIYNDGSRIYAISPFGHSMLLALGTLIHAEWAVNPLLGTAEIVVLYFLGKELYDETTGRIAALLGVASPFLLFMSSEFMNHASALLFLSLFLLFFFRTIRPLRGRNLSSSLADPLLSGLCLAMALNIRPLSALAVSLPIACYGIYLLFKSRGTPLPAFLVLLAPVLLGLGAFCLYNYLTTGSPLLPGYKAYCMLEYVHTRWGIGFGALGPTGLPPHTPLRGLFQTGDSLNALNLSLFEGPLPGLLLVLLLFLTFPRNLVDWLLLASFVALPVLYFFYWAQDLIFGPRFLYEGLAPILLLSARGVTEFPAFIGRVVGADAEARTRNVIAVGATVSLAVTAFFGLPKLTAQYGFRYLGVDNQVRARVAERGINNAVVFIGPPRTFYFGAGLLNNALDFQGTVVYARDRGAENYVLMRRLPGRAYYYADPWTFFRIRDLDSLRRTPEIRDLEQTGRFVQEAGVSGYRLILLPYREAGTFVDTAATPCRTFREVSYEMLRGRSKLADFLPAIAVFMPGDSRRYSPLFEPMRERRDYVSEGCRFTLMFSADSGRAAVYDIRSVRYETRDADPGTGVQTLCSVRRAPN